MGRGILSGVFWGLLVSVLATASLSLLVPRDIAAPDISQQTAVQPAEIAPVATPDPASVPSPAAAAETAPQAAEATATATPEASPEANSTAPVAIAAAPAANPGPVLPAPEAAPEAAPAISAAIAPSAPASESAPAAPTSAAPAAAVAPVVAVVAPAVVPKTATAPAEQAPAEQAPAEQAPAQTEQADTAQPVTVLAEQAPAAEAPVQATQSLLKPVSRLPTIGNSIAPSEAPVTAEAAPAADAELPVEGIILGESDAASALLRNRAVFEVPANRPLFAMILIASAQDNVAADVLQAIPFPVTFAIDPRQPGAPAAAQAYRAAGFEVVLLAEGLPQGATASDINVTLSAYFEAIPQAVAVMDTAENTVQDDRNTLTPLVGKLVETGHGFIVYNKGLNVGRQTAEREAVPVTTAFRAIDENDEDEPSIIRFLDRAAFKAGQDGHVVMVGHTRAVTVNALMAWALGGRAEQVALAPISAVLQAK